MDMCFRMRPGLTNVRVIDYSYVHSVSAEVEAVLPEESGIVQIEVILLTLPQLDVQRLCSCMSLQVSEMS